MSTSVAQRKHAGPSAHDGTVAPYQAGLTAQQASKCVGADKRRCITCIIFLKQLRCIMLCYGRTSSCLTIVLMIHISMMTCYTEVVMSTS
jgi:hypothetical protein